MKTNPNVDPNPLPTKETILWNDLVSLVGVSLLMYTLPQKFLLIGTFFGIWTKCLEWFKIIFGIYNRSQQTEWIFLK